ncbi:MAG: hypothetical protein LBI17_01680 [Rickettsiales bacterium]|nr:hypothetical protein [Rickettsiales bacterium]
MKKYQYAILSLALAGCTGLNRADREELAELKSYGITVENPRTKNWEEPKSPAEAALLNLLPGIGNFYLCGEETSHCTYGALNLLTWPLSVLWAVPDGAISANNINKRALVEFYRYEKKGKAELERLKAEL